MREFSNNHLVIACITAIGLCLSTMALAADDSAGYLAEYRAYNEALEAGDRTAAAAHALAAWDAAEKALGDHKTTAVLAYNYGQLILFDNPEAALPALTRAQELLEAGIAELPRADLEIFLAYVTFKVRGARREYADMLHIALQERDSEGVEASVESARIWLELAVFYINAHLYETAKESAVAAEAAIIAAVPEDYHARAQAIMIQGAAELLPINRFLSSIDAAHAHFVRASHLFPPQESIETFDPIFAQIIAWDAATRASLKSRGDRYRDKKREESWPDLAPPFKEELIIDDCAGDWEKRPLPKYPDLAAKRQYIGAAVIGYHLDEDGTVRGVRVLAEVPVDTFAKYTVKAMERWRYETPLDPRPGCRTDLLSTFEFVY